MKKEYGALINGKWILNKNSIKVYNPSNGLVISNVPNINDSQIINAIDGAKKAFEKWSRISSKIRSDILKKFFHLVKENKNRLAKIITLESGKPLGESEVEVEYGASFIEWSAEQALRVKGEIFESPESEKKMFTMKQPIGVVAAITPWNFPLAMVTRKVSAAVAAGCSVILKPSELTPITALELGLLSLKAGFPSGVFNIITGDPERIGKFLSKNEAIKKITFTGSTKVGKYLMKSSSSTVKNISLELGGNAPFIVFSDANINDAIDGFLMAKFRNAGQTCISANRLFVHESIFEKFVENLIKKVRLLKVGDGMKGNDIGPLISSEALNKIKNHVNDACNKGAKIVCGGKKHSQGDLFFQPTVFLNVKKSMKIFSNENFGPLIPIIKFKEDHEVIVQSNDTNYGLAAYFYTKNSSRIWKMINGLDYGMFGINSGKISTYLNPFGGLKESGIGREGSLQCLDPFLETKFILWNFDE
jgi:succinate-semialdehyde dehydrogenase/glutarate-semialdehyde dehydrogenase